MKNEKVLVKIQDADGDLRYSHYVLSPDGMPREDAEAAVSAAIDKVRGANPEEYQWDELVGELESIIQTARIATGRTLSRLTVSELTHLETS